MFGISFLRHFDGTPTSGFILWINGRGLIVNPPPFTMQMITKLHIAPNEIEWVLLT